MRVHPFPRSSCPTDQEPCQKRWRRCKQVVPGVAFRELLGDEPAADFITFQRFHPPRSDHRVRIILPSLAWSLGTTSHTPLVFSLSISFARPFLTIIGSNANSVCSSKWFWKFWSGSRSSSSVSCSSSPARPPSSHLPDRGPSRVTPRDHLLLDIPLLGLLLCGQFIQGRDGNGKRPQRPDRGHPDTREPSSLAHPPAVHVGVRGCISYSTDVLLPTSLWHSLSSFWLALLLPGLRSQVRTCTDPGPDTSHRLFISSVVHELALSGCSIMNMFPVFICSLQALTATLKSSRPSSLCAFGISDFRKFCNELKVVHGGLATDRPAGR